MSEKAVIFCSPSLNLWETEGKILRDLYFLLLLLHLATGLEGAKTGGRKRKLGDCHVDPGERWCRRHF